MSSSTDNNPEAVDIASLHHELTAADSLDSIRSVVKREFIRELLPTPFDVRAVLMVALRVVELTCAAIDQLLRENPNGGAFQDTGLYRPCRHVEIQGNSGTGLDELTPMICAATNYLEQLDGFIDYASSVLAVVPMSSFLHESDDLVIHRCLLGTEMLSEVYIRAIQSHLTPAECSHGIQPAIYPKGDLKQAVLQTACGPILGHHQLMLINASACTDSRMDPEVAFVSYKANFIWFADWATANREDGDVLAELNLNTPDFPRNEWPYAWAARLKIGDILTRYIARLDHITDKESSNAFSTHTGVLCYMNEWLRKVIIASLCYGSYGLWPTPHVLSASEYAEYVCAAIGCMVRGWAIDHDTEASIGEYNPINWVCRDCSTAATRESLYVANAVAERADWAMRIAWGPQSYFWNSMRHHGFARRVDNLSISHSPKYIKFRSIVPYCTPIKAGDSVSVIVTKLFALCGLERIDDSELELGEREWTCNPRICPTCEFAEYLAQAFMFSVGAARLAIRLEEGHRAKFVHIMETYGTRLFPALQLRQLVQCHCLPNWMADVMSHGYQEAGSTCGQSDCSVRAQKPLTKQLLPDRGERAEYDGILLTETLLKQALVEAEEYAVKSGQQA